MHQASCIGWNVPRLHISQSLCHKTPDNIWHMKARLWYAWYWVGGNYIKDFNRHAHQLHLFCDQSVLQSWHYDLFLSQHFILRSKFIHHLDKIISYNYKSANAEPPFSISRKYWFSLVSAHIYRPSHLSLHVMVSWLISM